MTPSAAGASGTIVRGRCRPPEQLAGCTPCGRVVDTWPRLYFVKTVFRFAFSSNRCFFEGLEIARNLSLGIGFAQKQFFFTLTSISRDVLCTPQSTRPNLTDCPAKPRLGIQARRDCGGAIRSGLPSGSRLPTAPCTPQLCIHPFCGSAGAAVCHDAVHPHAGCAHRGQPGCSHWAQSVPDGHNPNAPCRYLRICVLNV